jgi:hypothetical protein
MGLFRRRRYREYYPPERYYYRQRRRGGGFLLGFLEGEACCCIVDELFGGDQCFVATASFGERDAPEVVTLRAYRDRVLSRSLIGRLFVRAYYRFGPYGAALLHGHPWRKRVMRTLLRPVVTYAARRAG